MLCEGEIRRNRSALIASFQASQNIQILQIINGQLCSYRDCSYDLLLLTRRKVIEQDNLAVCNPTVSYIMSVSILFPMRILANCWATAY